MPTVGRSPVFGQCRAVFSTVFALQVESSFQPLQALPGVSASQQLLLLLSSGLMVPRALLQCELMWFTGTARWAALHLTVTFLLLCYSQGAVCNDTVMLSRVLCFFATFNMYGMLLQVTNCAPICQKVLPVQYERVVLVYG